MSIFKIESPYLVLEKIEFNDHCYFKKHKALTLNNDILRELERDAEEFGLIPAVRVCLDHRDVVLHLTLEELQRHAIYSDVTSRKLPEEKTSVPLTAWRIVSGDANWAKRMNVDAVTGRLFTP